LRIESFDRAGQAVSSSLGKLKIDKTAPVLAVKLRGSGSYVTVSGTATEAKPPKGSGLTSVKVNFGDGSPSVTVRSSFFRLKHRSRRGGKLTVTVTATDAAGNRSVFAGKVKVAN
jgi:hypothetical protein